MDIYSPLKTTEHANPQKIHTSLNIECSNFTCDGFGVAVSDPIWILSSPGPRRYFWVPLCEKAKAERNENFLKSKSIIPVSAGSSIFKLDARFGDKQLEKEHFQESWEKLIAQKNSCTKGLKYHRKLLNYSTSLDRRTLEYCSRLPSDNLMSCLIFIWTLTGFPFSRYKKCCDSRLGTPMSDQ